MPTTIRTEANRLYNEGKFTELIAFLDKNLNDKITDAELWRLYGAALSSLDHHEAAHRAFTVALKLDPKDPTAMVNLITTKLDLGRVHEAFDGINVAFASLPDIDRMFVVNALTRELSLGRIMLPEIPIQVRQYVEANLMSGPPLQKEPKYKKASPAVPVETTALLDALETGEFEAILNAITQLNNERALKELLFDFLQTGKLDQARLLLYFGIDLTSDADQHRIWSLIEKNPAGEAIEELLENFWVFKKPAEAGRSTLNTVLDELSYALFGRRIHFHRLPNELKDAGKMILYADLSAPEVLHPAFVKAVIETFNLTPWDEREDLHPHIPRTNGGVDEKAKVLVLKLHTSEPAFGNIPDPDSEHSMSWHRWGALQFESVTWPDLFRELGTSDLYGSHDHAMILALAPQEDTPFRSLNKLDPSVFDQMKQVVSKLHRARSQSDFEPDKPTALSWSDVQALLNAMNSVVYHYFNSHVFEDPMNYLNAASRHWRTVVRQFPNLGRIHPKGAWIKEFISALYRMRSPDEAQRDLGYPHSSITPQSLYALLAEEILAPLFWKDNKSVSEFAEMMFQRQGLAAAAIALEDPLPHSPPSVGTGGFRRLVLHGRDTPGYRHHRQERKRLIRRDPLAEALHQFDKELSSRFGLWGALERLLKR